jgi:hypothetical protein
MRTYSITPLSDFNIENLTSDLRNWKRHYRDNLPNIKFLDSNNNLLNKDVLPICFIDFSSITYLPKIVPKTKWSKSQKNLFLSKLEDLNINFENSRYNDNHSSSLSYIKSLVNSINYIEAINLDIHKYTKYSSLHFLEYFIKCLDSGFTFQNLGYGMSNGVIFNEYEVLAIITVNPEKLYQFTLNFITRSVIKWKDLITVYLKENESDILLTSEIQAFCEKNTIDFKYSKKFDFIEENFISKIEIKSLDDYDRINKLFSKIVSNDLLKLFNIKEGSRDLADTYILLDELPTKSEKPKIEESISEEITESDLLLINQLLIEE